MWPQQSLCQGSTIYVAAAKSLYQEIVRFAKQIKFGRNLGLTVSEYIAVYIRKVGDDSLSYFLECGFKMNVVFGVCVFSLTYL